MLVWRTWMDAGARREYSKRWDGTGANARGKRRRRWRWTPVAAMSALKGSCCVQGCE